MGMAGSPFRIWRTCAPSTSPRKYDLAFIYKYYAFILIPNSLNPKKTTINSYIQRQIQQKIIAKLRKHLYNYYIIFLMPKSNRKGYFQKQLRREGINQEVLNLKTKLRGRRKQPKIAAKQARQRKKIYMTHMEQRIAELNCQMEELRRQNAQLKHQVEFLKTQPQKQQRTQIPPIPIPEDLQTQNSKTRFNGLIKQIKKLSINLQNNDNEQIARNLSVLRDKYGISGRQRLKNIDELFDKIVSTMMPMHFRLLMEHCLDNKQFYTLLSSQFRNHKLIKLQDKVREILIRIRPQIVRQHEQYDRLLIALAELRTRIKGQNYKCQSIVDEIEDGINPTFVGRLLLDLDFCRRQDNLENIYPMNFWNRSKDDGFQLVLPHNRVENYVNQIKEQNLFNFQNDMEIINELFF